MRIAILGFGREGRAVSEFLRKSPKYDFAEIWILDENSKLKIEKSLVQTSQRFGGQASSGYKIKKKTGKNYLKGLEKFDLIFRSPGVSYNLPEIQQAIKKGVIFSSATKLFFENCHCRIIGVTGTKGKGTTSTLLYQILKNDGLDAYLAGNIGKPALEILPELKKHSVAVLELSSFQLQDLIISPQVAVVLDVFPDHLDAHKNFKEYLEAKRNIARYQTGDNQVFYFRGNKFSARVARHGLGKKISVAATTKLFKPEELKILGEHNFKNAIMAATVAQEMGCDKDIIRDTVLNFGGLEHRLEFVRIVVIARRSPEATDEAISSVRLGRTGKIATGTTAVGPRNDITASFYNDSASTNPQTTIAAIQSFKGPTILIAGGHDKGLDYEPLGKIIKKTSVKLVVLFGTNKEKIKKHLKRFPTLLCKDLKFAVFAAVQHASNDSGGHSHRHSHAIILFSPGSASFDMFKDYTDRGQKLKEIVANL